MKDSSGPVEFRFFPPKSHLEPPPKKRKASKDGLVLARRSSVSESGLPTKVFKKKEVVYSPSWPSTSEEVGEAANGKGDFLKKVGEEGALPDLDHSKVMSIAGYAGSRPRPSPTPPSFASSVADVAPLKSSLHPGPPSTTHPLSRALSNASPSLPIQPSSAKHRMADLSSDPDSIYLLLRAFDRVDPNCPSSRTSNRPLEHWKGDARARLRSASQSYSRGLSSERVSCARSLSNVPPRAYHPEINPSSTRFEPPLRAYDGHLSETYSGASSSQVSYPFENDTGMEEFDRRSFSDPDLLVGEGEYSYRTWTPDRSSSPHDGPNAQLASIFLDPIYWDHLYHHTYLGSSSSYSPPASVPFLYDDVDRALAAHWKPHRT